MAGLNSLSIISDQYIGTVQIDAKIAEQHESTITVTEFPLEDGAIATDHRIIKPKILRINGIVSNAKSTLENITGHQGNSDVSTYEQLVQLQESGVPFDIVTDLVVYRNVLIKEISTEKNVTLANSLNFYATLQTILIIDTKSVKLPKNKIPAPNTDRAASTDDQGVKTPTSAGKVTDDANMSISKKIAAAGV